MTWPTFWQLFDNFDNFQQVWQFLTIFDNFYNFYNFQQCLTIFTILTIWDNLYKFWQFWQFLQFLAILKIWAIFYNCDTGQHSQFLGCFFWELWTLNVPHRSAEDKVARKLKLFFVNTSATTTSLQTLSICYVWKPKIWTCMYLFYMQIWPPVGTTFIGWIFYHHMALLALQCCVGLLYWHNQHWYLHQPESHQLSLNHSWKKWVYLREPFLRPPTVSMIMLKEEMISLISHQIWQ